jgi:magnesium-transporting ATPase (P-type)
LKEVPKNYKENYIGFVKDGARVLALAYRDLSVSLGQAESLTRD